MGTHMKSVVHASFNKAYSMSSSVFNHHLSPSLSHPLSSWSLVPHRWPHRQGSRRRIHEGDRQAPRPGRDDHRQAPGPRVTAA